MKSTGNTCYSGKFWDLFAATMQKGKASVLGDPDICSKECASFAE